MPLRFLLRRLCTRGVGTVSAAVLVGTVIGVSSVIVAHPATRRTTRDDAKQRRQHRDPRIERAACGICGHVGATADAEFCGDCGLLVQPECFGGYCDACCRPRCTRCAAQANDSMCAQCHDRDQESRCSA